MNRRIAIFKSGNSCEMIGDDTWETYNDGEYVRQSEYLDLDFPERDLAEIVPEQVAMLETAKEKLHEKYVVACVQIDEKISRLLAIEDKGE